jgi:hypothetical protein
MLEDLCPLCGAAYPTDADACLICGFSDGHARPRRPADRALPIVAILAAGAVVGLVLALGSDPRATEPAPSPAHGSAASDRAELPQPPRVGPVLFVDQHRGPLDRYRTRFERHETIAWRAEFPEPPGTDELTLVIAWQSIREEMVLSRTTVRMQDAESTVIASDETPISELVPSAGIYAVTYYAGDTKLAAGVFEVLPREP